LRAFPPHVSFASRASALRRGVRISAVRPRALAIVLFVIGVAAVAKIATDDATQPAGHYAHRPEGASAQVGALPAVLGSDRRWHGSLGVSLRRRSPERTRATRHRAIRPHRASGSHAQNDHAASLPASGASTQPSQATAPAINPATTESASVPSNTAPSRTSTVSVSQPATSSRTGSGASRRAGPVGPGAPFGPGQLG
jgi:hypothetical protein